MAWCPRCRINYPSDVIICSDCGAALVEELPEEFDYNKVIMIAPRKEAENFYDLLKKFDMKRAKLIYNEEVSLYHVSVPESQVEKAKKLAMIQKINLQDELPEVKHVPTPVKKQEFPYVHHSERHQDLISSAYSFLLVGGLGLSFILLSTFQVIHLPLNDFTKDMLKIIVGVLCIIFFVAGLWYLKGAHSIKKLAMEEDKLTKEITQWFKKGFDTFVIDTDIDENLEEEIKYFRRCEAMKQIIKQSYGELDERYLDRLIDELYQYLYEDM